MKIKLLPFLILILWLGTHGSFAQVGNLMTSIRADVAQINASLSTYTRKTKTVDGLSLEGTEANYYSRDKELKKIAARMYGETYNAAVELYYKGDALIFAYYRFNRYDTQIGLPKPPKVVSSQENRLYFADGKLAKLLIGKMEIRAGSEQWKESETEIADLARKLRSEFEAEAT